MRTCLNKQCCEMRYKQPIGELIMTCIMCIVYFGTIVGVMLPKIDEFLDPKKTVSKQTPEFRKLKLNSQILLFMLHRQL